MSYYSGTDKIVLEKYFPEFSGIMIEAGAGGPEFLSMSKAFRERGWRTICVEPNPKYVQQHKNAGNEIYNYAISSSNIKDSNFTICEDDGDGCFSGLSTSAIEPRQNEHNFLRINIIKIDIVTLNWLLDEINVDHVDFASIDVEGWELEAMQGFDTDKYKPSIICLECYYPGKPEMIVKYNSYMNSIGYNLVDTDWPNYIYKRQ